MVWINSLIKKKRYDSPVVECTPVVWQNRLLVVELWQKHWDNPPGSVSDSYVRVRDDQTDEILSTTMEGFGFASAFAWDETLYVFASKRVVSDDDSGNHDSHNTYMTSTRNLKDWTDPICIIEEEPGEMLYNQSVCHNGSEFIMAYESNQGVPFTLKFARSGDLINWQKISGAIYGKDKYAACPAIRYARGYYYMLYLEWLKPDWCFETYLTRSRDLKDWQQAPHNPVIKPDYNHLIHPDCLTEHEHNEEPGTLCPANGKEINASDPDLVKWKGKTRVYFTGGCQHWGGCLQHAEFDGNLLEFFESYFKK